MKVNSIHKAVLAIITTAIISTTAQANTRDVQFYATAKAGMLNLGAEVESGDTKVKRNDAFDNPTMIGVSIGTVTARNFGVELDYSQSTKAKDDSSEDKSDSKTKTTDKSDNKKKVNSKNIGLYGTYHLPVEDGFYLKGKLGLAQASIESSDGESKQKKQGIAGGVGLGYSLTPRISLETEYTRLPTIEDSDDDGDVLKVTNNQFTLGAKIKF